MFEALVGNGLSEYEAAATAWPSDEDRRREIEAHGDECPDRCGYACGRDSTCWAEQQAGRVS